MNADSPSPAPMPSQNDLALKVFGIGTVGCNVLQEMMRGGLPAAACVAVGADPRFCASLSLPPGQMLLLESAALRGMGVGGDPDQGRAVAEENLPRLKEACQGAQMVFIVAGLDGGLGIGVSPVLARVAAESGALVLAFVSSPYGCEGSHRLRAARQGLEELRTAADGVICLPNAKVLKLIDEKTSVTDTFKMSTGLLAECARSVWRLLTRTGLIEIHFADLCALLRGRHVESSFAVAEASGPNRVREVTDKLLAHPLLENGQALADSEAVLVSLVGGPDLAMADITRLMEQLNCHCEDAQVIMGAALDDDFRERLAVTLIATRKSQPPVSRDEPKPRSAEGQDLGEHLLAGDQPPRAPSRLVPPPPAWPQDKMRELLIQQHQTAASRPRKALSKFRQTHLPLEIVSKGRFDQSEPTIHRGEDLDMPTYIRRGVSLN